MSFPYAFEHAEPFRNRHARGITKGAAIPQTKLDNYVRYLKVILKDIL